ncbi:undecaprenyl/decaprenyl-phosphate alpha-N-acetylglucosaminyl 1-phosphate transferase [candidate division KSB1 bacterium]|nr:undecaprenyl/decaprenyl-phosphate alpha-N-acetylglucosaminyl 1-phosphate transferase [candidate division KSB1 bacterium]
MWFIIFPFIFAETFVISYFLVPLVNRLAQRFAVLDNPGQRKVHKKPKPLMGGLAIFSAFFLVVAGNTGLALAFPHHSLFHQIPQFETLVPLMVRALPQLLIILSGGFAIHLLGLLDDIYKDRLSYQLKFLVQTVIALLVSIAGVRTHFMPFEFLDVIVTTLWIIGVTNSFNLLDNLDGLTAGISVIAGFLLFIIALMQLQVFFGLLLLALAGSSLGFLLHNFYPSKLFMGDSGSLFLGFMFASVTVSGSYVVETSSSLLPVTVPVLILSIPLYDTFSVMFIRWREKRPLFLGDKRHFSHRLLELGMSHRQTVIFIYLVSFCVGLTALLLPYLSVAGNLAILLQAIIIYILITILVVYGKRNTQENKKNQQP